MFGNLSLYVAQEHTLAALKGMHPSTNQYPPYGNMEPINNSVFDPIYHQLPSYQNYPAKDKFQTGHGDMHAAYEAHRALHFPTFHLSFPQRLPSPNRAPMWHQTATGHQQGQMSLNPDQGPLQLAAGLTEKCAFAEDKKPKAGSTIVTYSGHETTKINEIESISSKAWTTPSHNSVYYDQKLANGNLTNWFYENPNLVLGKLS